jgi:hypothetical protein
MAHYAFLNENNIVTEVIVGNDETTADWETYYHEFRGQACKQTSYNTYGGIHYTDGEPSADQTKAFRFNYAGIGYSYDEDRDAFIPPTPYPSWVLDEDTCLWVAPIPMPEDGDYTWNEDTQSWDAVSEA